MSEFDSANDAWYAAVGPENDVAVSTRVRLARNLANFPFPQKFRGDDAQRVQTLVFDSFTHAENPDSYQVLALKDLDELGKKILTERGVIEESSVKAPASGIIMRTDGRLACTVNDVDHLRFASFSSGLDAEGAFNRCRTMDNEIQQFLQFAASYDFGFLTANVKDCGSGMKISVRVHLPSIASSRHLTETLFSLEQKGISASACFGAGVESGSSLGNYYQISTKTAAEGSEIDQLAVITSAVQYLANLERESRAICQKGRLTEVQDKMYRSYGKAKFSLLMPLREAVDIISGIKWGKDLGFISGIEYSELAALLYRIQEGHLQFVLKNGNFSFPEDIASDNSMQVLRLRSLILQEAFEHLKI